MATVGMYNWQHISNQNNFVEQWQRMTKLLEQCNHSFFSGYLAVTTSLLYMRAGLGTNVMVMSV